MKFGKEALLSLAAMCCWVAFDAEAFVPHAKPSRLALVKANHHAPLSATSVILRLAADDDLDEMEDDGPLGKGVDSVSWLPTVVGKKGGSVSGVKEVSFLLLVSCHRNSFGQLLV
jgi:hypothetical protein